MNPKADTTRSSLVQDPVNRLSKARVVVLFGNAETARQVVRSNQHSIQARHSEDFVQGFYGGRALNVDDQEVLGVALLEVSKQLRLELLAPQGGSRGVAPSMGGT